MAATVVVSGMGTGATGATGVDGSASGAVSKTPLAACWALWEVRSTPGAVYTEAVHPVGSFNTLESFWAYWSRLPRLAALFNDGVSSACRRGLLRAWRPVGDSSVPRPPESVILDGFAVFREGVRPEWEDAANRDGGEWGCRKGAWLRHAGLCVPLCLQALACDICRCVCAWSFA